MVIHCPKCRHAIRLVDIRPGRFEPTCPRCKTTFRLTIPAEGAEPTVEPIDPAAAAAAPSIEAIPTTLETIDDEAVEDVSFRFNRLPRGVPRLLGGCFVLKLLGHGPRGKTLLARPLSLAPPVVLKLISADRQRDAVFVERHLREALAASRLSSPHLARIVDIGRDRHAVYTAIEYVPGASLADEIVRRGRVEPLLAASWILQAARGLAEAHAQEIHHRDIKPQNLRLNRDGLIVVDDLGLETTPSLAAAESRLDRIDRKGPAGRGSTVSRDAAPALSVERVAIGTPGYMAPEQARDALVVDGRADVYSLGCVFYELVTGRPPFSKPTATELLASHQNEPLIPPREFVPKLSPAIGETIEAMTRKAPEERLASMNAVVDALEACLGLRTGAAEAEETAYREAIREASALIDDAPEIVLRRRIQLSVGGVWAALVLLLFVRGAFRPAIVIGGFGALVAAAMGLTSGSLRSAGLLGALRELILGDGLRSWLIIAIGVVVALGLAVGGGFLGALVFVGVCAGGLIGAFHYYVERPCARIVAEAVARVSGALGGLRRRGYDETFARWTLAAEAGSNWEMLYAALFGDRALEAERHRNSVDATVLERLSWRGAAGRLIAALLDARRDARLGRLFQQVEEARFEAEGLNQMTARRRSWRAAKALVLAAAEWRDEQAALQGRGSTTAAGPALPRRLREAVEAPEHVLERRESHPGPIRRRLESFANVAFGRTTRAALGAAMLAGLALWSHQRGVVTASQVGEAAAEVGRAARQAAENADPSALGDIHVDIPLERSRFLQPLGVGALPEPLRSTPAANLGVAGLLLLFASLYPSRALGFFSLVAAAVILLGHSWNIAGSWLGGGFDAPAQAMIAGGLILAAAILVFRR